MLVVLAFHLGALPGGFLGVDLFFVISGFVITRLLLREQAATGRVDLGRFWARRVRRLMPSILLILLSTQLWLHVVQPVGLENVVDGQTLSSLVYATNWWDIVANLGYADAAGTASPLNHLWSLAIEEQFYLGWPLLLIMARKRWMIAAIATTGTAISIALPILFDSAWTFDRLYQGTDVRMVALFAGVLLALSGLGDGRWRDSKAVAPRSVLTLRVIAPWVGLAACGGLVWFWATLEIGKGIFSGALLAATVLEAVLVAAVIIGGARGMGRILSSKIALFIGRRSYAIYLWHWPIIVVTGSAYLGLSDGEIGFTRLILITTLPLLSYALIENPIRRLPSLRPRGWATLVAACVAAACLALAPVGVLPHPNPGSPVAGSGSVEQPELSPVTPGLRVLVVGDSWAANLAEGMADPSFGATVTNLGLGGCGIADPDAYMNNDETVVSPPAECLSWRERWAATISSGEFDAVVLDVGNYDQRKARIDGQWVYVGDAAFDGQYSAHLDEAITILAAGGVPVFVTTTVVLNGDPFHAHSMRMNELLTDAVRRNETARLAPVGEFFCHADEQDDCPAARDGQPIYDPTGHPAAYWQIFSAQFVLNGIQSALG